MLLLPYVCKTAIRDGLDEHPASLRQETHDYANSN